MESKAKLNSCSARPINRILALLVALGMVTSASSLFAEDKDQDREKAPDAQTPIQRDLSRADDEHEDLNAKTDPEKFIRKVAQSWETEIRVGNLAKQRAQSQEVKQFAEKLVQDHTKANDELKRIAQQKSIVLGSDSAGTTTTPVTPTTPGEKVGAPGTPRADHVKPHEKQAYERLTSLSGKAFDDAYMTHQVQCHSKSVAKFEKASKDLADAELKQFVESTLPTLREHLAMAQRLAPPDASRLNVRERTDKDADYKKDQDKPK